MKTLWAKISGIGVHPELQSEDARSIIFVNRICAIMLLFVATSVMINVALGSSLFIPALSISLVLLLLSYVLNSKRAYFFSKSIIILVPLCLITYMSLRGGAGSGLKFYVLSLIALPVI